MISIYIIKKYQRLGRYKYRAHLRFIKILSDLDEHVLMLEGGERSEDGANFVP